MLSLATNRSPWALWLGLTLAAVLPAPGGVAAADKGRKGDVVRIPFRTVDGVELQGTFYPANPAAKKDAVVLLIPDFDPRKGGSSQQLGIVELSKALQKQGYPVLTFDFRGFGESKNVSERLFWDLRVNPQNARANRRRMKASETIDQKDFDISYYPFLVNDVAAAKAFLERKNDAREVNSSNVVLIGVGNGATLGALWLASEFHRQKIKRVPIPGRPLTREDVEDPEGKDVAAAIWVGIKPTLPGRGAVPVKNWLVEAGKTNKVPMAFLYGGGDSSAERAAASYLQALGASGRDSKLKNTGKMPIGKTALSGSELLQDKKAQDWIAKTYLDSVLETRGSHEWKRRKPEEYSYYWIVGRQAVMAKQFNDELMRPLPLEVFMGR